MNSVGFTTRGNSNREASDELGFELAEFELSVSHIQMYVSSEQLYL